MHNCDSLDPLVTPFVDGVLPDADRRAVEDHLRKCPPCHSRVAAERAVHELLQARRSTLCRATAPDALHLRCAEAAKKAETAELLNVDHVRTQNPRTQNPGTKNPGTKNPGTKNPEPGTRNEP